MDMPPKVQRTQGSQEHWVVFPPTHCLGPWPGGHHQAALIPDIAWKYM